MPGVFSQRVGARSGRNLDRFFLQWEASDGLDDDGRMVARTGQVVTFSRGGTVGAAWAQDGRGLYRLAGAQEPRFAHRYNPTTGLWEPDGLTLENQTVNVALGSNLFSRDAPYWGWNVQPTLVAVNSCMQGQVAYKHTDTAGGSHYRGQKIGVYVNAQPDCLWAILENVDATEAMLGNFDGGTSAFLAATKLTWSTLTVANDQGTTPTASGVINLGIGPNGGQMVLLYVTGTGTAAGTGAAGHNRVALLYYCGMPSNTKSAIVHHIQLSTSRTFPDFSPIATVAASVTRAADAFTVPFNFNPADFTLLVGVTVPTGCLSVYDNFINIGSNSNGAEIYMHENGNPYAEIRGTPNTPAQAGNLTARTVAWLCAQFKDWGTGPSCRLDAGTGFGSWSSTSNSRTSFGAALVNLGTGSNGGASTNYRSVRAASGLQTRDYMMAG